MSEPASTSSAAPPATGAAPWAAASPAPAAAASGAPPLLPDGVSAPASGKVERPAWLPEDHWDGTANTIKPEFGKHYADLKAVSDAETARKAALPQKAEDYKIEIKLPPEVKIPD